MSETELKYALDEEAVSLLRHRFAQLAADAVPPASERLHSVYYDTRGYRLKKAGVALRLRQTPEGWVQTVKAKARNATGLQMSDEAEAPVAASEIRLDAIPDKALRKTVRALVGDRRLLPVCETDIARCAVLVHGPDGAAVEAALDEGRISAGARSELVRELELELKAGSPAALYTLAAELLPGCGHHAARLSKSERGYRLALEGDDALSEPEIAPAQSALASGMTAGAAAQALLRDRTGQVMAALSRIAEPDETGAAAALQAAFFALCATLDLFEPLLGGTAWAHLRAEAGWLAGLTARQSDLEGGRTLVAGADAAELAALADEIGAQAEANRRRLADLPGLSRTQRFAIELAQFAELGTPPRDAKQARRRGGKLRPRLRRELAKAQGEMIRLAGEVADNALLLPALDRLAAALDIAAPLLPRAEAKARRSPVAALLNVLAPARPASLALRLWPGEGLARPDAPGSTAALAALRKSWGIEAEAAVTKAGPLWAGLARKPGSR